jgi:uncharacterized protein YbjQ (UPF0145 family)
MIITSTETIPNKEIEQILGIARGSTVRARNIGNDIMAGQNQSWAVKWKNTPNFRQTRESRLFNV